MELQYLFLSSPKTEKVLPLFFFTVLDFSLRSFKVKVEAAVWPQLVPGPMEPGGTESRYPGLPRHDLHPGYSSPPLFLSSSTFFLSLSTFFLSLSTPLSLIPYPSLSLFLPLSTPSFLSFSPCLPLPFSPYLLPPFSLSPLAYSSLPLFLSLSTLVLSSPPCLLPSLPPCLL